MDAYTLEKLEWPILLDHLAKHARTEEAQSLLLALAPDLDREKIESSWQQISDIKQINFEGYNLPIDGLSDLRQLLKTINLGQLLSGQDLRLVYDLLQACTKIASFGDMLKAKSPTLSRYRSQLYPLPKLAQAIREAVNDEGELLDEASPQLVQIRKSKRSIRKKIEEKLTALIHNSDLLDYLQDDFFTVRSDRYVVPIKVDGRGRVRGKVVDTSDSGQTLFLEPLEIADSNEQLIDLELQEKLEVIRIFKHLSELAHSNIEILSANYQNFVAIDLIHAKALLANDLKACAPKAAAQPILSLINARHPLLKPKNNSAIIANTIQTVGQQHILVISGPNAGGKTVVLKTVGMLHLMAKAGLLLPCDQESEVYIFNRIYIEMGDSQNLQANLSTFSGHLMGLKPILEKASRDDLILLDEIAVGTEPQTGSAIAQAVVESLAGNKITAMVTTHYDSLKALAINDGRFRNGSMEYSIKNYKPTFRLLWDIPGQSFGIELAREIGLPEAIIERAQELRGTSANNFETVIHKFLEEQEKIRDLEQQLSRSRLEADTAKAHFDAEKASLELERKRIAQKFSSMYRDKLDELSSEYHEMLARLKKEASRKPTDDSDLSGIKQSNKDITRKFADATDELFKMSESAKSLPGEPCTLERAKIGDTVYIIPLQKQGKIISIPKSEEDAFEIQMGIIKLNSIMQDLRLLTQATPLKTFQKATQIQKAKPQESPFTLRTSTNSIDLRGLDQERAIEATFAFIDSALLRGENHLVIVHGHGTGSLKAGIRKALGPQCPYQLSYRPGGPEEGGDGVTIVSMGI